MITSTADASDKLTVSSPNKLLGQQVVDYY